MAGTYVNLHSHSDKSLLDGLGKAEHYAKRAKELGIPALAVTDHGNVHALLEIWDACQEYDLQFIPGQEFYQARKKRSDRDEEERAGRANDELVQRGPYHLTVLGRNDAGYRNLIRLSSDAYLEGFFVKPRCLLPGQEIVTKNGFKCIEDIRPGDLVMTHKGRFRKVSNVFKNSYDGIVHGVRLSSNYNRVLWITPDHPILIRDRKGCLSWVKTKDIVSGRALKTERIDAWSSYVCLPKSKSKETVTCIDTTDFMGHTKWEPMDENKWRKAIVRSRMGPSYHYAQLASNIKLDYDFGRFIGLYIAESSIDRGRSVSWHLHEDEHEMAEFISRFCVQLIAKPALKANLEHRGSDYHGMTVTCHSTILAGFLEGLCSKGAAFKSMPEFVFDAPEEFQLGITAGVLEGDADLTRANATPLGQTSKNLAWQMRTLMTHINGCFACVTPIDDGNEKHAIQYTSNFSNINCQFRHTIEDDQFIYKPIKDIVTKEYDGLVYNIEVEEDNSYVSDFALHNCDHELIERHAEGLIVLSGCLNGEVSQALLRDDYDFALHSAARMQEIVGRENYFIEVQDHGLPEQKQIMASTIKIAQAINAPIVPSCDSHYVHQHEAHVHDLLLCCSTKALKSEENRFKFYNDQFYLKSYDEMAQVFPKEWLANTLRVAEMVDVKLTFGELYFPQFRLPEHQAADDLLDELTWTGCTQRYGENPTQEVIDRITEELRVIKKMNFQHYFLVVSDITAYARRQKIRLGPSRGSAASSCVSYCLGITKVDPISYGLLFERFLIDGRPSPPDIDIDVDDRRRGELIAYVRDTYGVDRVAQICTFSSVGARAAVKDAGRVLGHDFQTCQTIANTVPPPVFGESQTLAQSLDSAEMQKVYQSDPVAKEVIDAAMGLEGVTRQTGIHAAGVVITPGPLTDFVPVMRTTLKDGTPGPIVTQWDMHDIDRSGILKIDFLGLINLGIIDECVKTVSLCRGLDVDVDHLPLDDPDTYAMLSSGDSSTIFQLESDGMTRLMIGLQPENIFDIMALVALYRPGPMGSGIDKSFVARRRGKEKVTYLHPSLAPILDSTQGVMIYQESIIKIAREVAGFAPADAGLLLKTIGKKIPEKLKAYRDQFVTGCATTSKIPSELANKIFSDIEHFGHYGFSLAHSSGYSVISFITAYLKCHYPTEYMAAVLTMMNDQEQIGSYIRECKRMGIDILPPSINASHINFSVHDDSIRFGLGAIAGIGSATLAPFFQARRPYTSLYDFFRSAPPDVFNKKIIESLIDAGALDELIGDQPPRYLPRSTRIEILDAERRMLGSYLTDHPLASAWNDLKPLVDTTLDKLVPEMGRARVCGILTSVERLITKRGQLMYRMTLEDLTGSRTLLAFSKIAEQYEQLFIPHTIVVCDCGLRQDEDSVTLFLNAMSSPTLTEGMGGTPIVVSVTRPPTSEDLHAIDALIEQTPGDSPVILRLSQGTKYLFFQFKKPTSPSLYPALQGILS